MISLDTVVESACIYLVICSRGPGSDTMTASIHIPVSSAYKWLERNMIEGGHEKAEVAKAVASLKQNLEEPEVDTVLVDGLVNIYVDQFEEGPVFLVRKPLTIREIILGILYEDPEYCARGDISYCTAVYRALVNNWPPNKTFEKWSSINGWRSPVFELMPQWQVDQCLELFDLTVEGALTCNCDVLRLSMKSPSRDYRGC